MYVEFVIIFAGLALLALLLAASIVLQIVILVKVSKKGAPQTGMQQAQSAAAKGRVVFCKNCATQYDASLNACPKCGTRR